MKADLNRLRHMLDAAKDAISFAEGHERSDIDHDRKLLLSIVKSIEIIGEAASKVSIEMQERFPSIPWPEIITMRHRLVHGYFDIDHDIVWQTVQEDLPPFVLELSRVIRHEEEGGL
jgi:uncharacterized protein with HEPN domain